jgi:hypothetical protein
MRARRARRQLSGFIARAAAYRRPVAQCGRRAAR